MRVLVLGGYGLIGIEIVRRLRAADISVAGLGRSASAGRRVAPQVEWLAADIAALTTPESWKPHLTRVDAVVNAAGALQDGLRDHLDAIHHRAIAALVAACESQGVRRFIQISAPGADTAAATAFLCTKGAGDQAVRASALDWIIFKPGLVISAYAYGGTSLLRQLAAFPVVQPILLAGRRVQIVAASDVADAVLTALSAQAPVRRDFDLVHATPHRLDAIVAAFRAWLGLAPARAVVAVPRRLGFTLARGADAAGWLGWRSPARTTALRMLDREVLGDGAAWAQATGKTFKSLAEAFGALPATAQERRYARTQLVFPVALATLSGFWLASGVVGLFRAREAASVLAGTLLEPHALAFVAAGAIADIAVGVALCLRPFLHAALAATVAISLCYLALASLYVPALWLDPLGPLVKVFPSIALSLAVAAMSEDR